MDFCFLGYCFHYHLTTRKVKFPTMKEQLNGEVFKNVFHSTYYYSAFEASKSQCFSLLHSQTALLLTPGGSKTQNSGRKGV